MKHAVLFSLFFLFFVSLNAQKNGTLLIITNSLAEVYVDGKSVGKADNNAPSKFDLQAGEHLVVLKALNPEAAGQEKKQLITITFNQQSIFEAEFTKATIIQQNCVTQVADINFTIQGTAEKELNNTTNGNSKDAAYYFMFDKGDLLKFNFSIENKQGTAGLRVYEYETNQLVYGSENISDAGYLTINIANRGIYKFEFTTKHTFNRKANFKISKENPNPESCKLNSSVRMMELPDTTFETKNEIVYDVMHIKEPTTFILSSNKKQTNPDIGKNTTIELNLPANVVSWYYLVAASYTSTGAENLRKTFSLKQEIEIDIKKYNTMVLDDNKLRCPDGDAYFNLYLVDFLNAQTFKKGKTPKTTVNTRLEAKSKLIRPENCNGGTWYLCLEPTKSKFDTHFIVEVVAVVGKETGNKVQVVKHISKKIKPVPAN